MITNDDARWLSRQASIGSLLRGRRAGVSDRLAGARVLVVGGGTAGYLTALAFRRHTAATVRLVESSSIAHIGVGEATVPSIVSFLHGYLGIDMTRFYAEVRPTWKMGIKFQWGLPSPYYFLAPFDWGVDSVGALGSLREHDSLNEMSLMAMLMDQDRVPMFWGPDRKAISLLSYLPVAYHFDVSRLITFLGRHAIEQGVEHIDAVVQDVRLGPTGDVRAVITDRGEIDADFFVDCSGFRSLIVGKTLGSTFVSFDASLFTDSAVAFERPHDGHVKPYTTATTMDAGWTWTIPQVDDDHCGYVFSSRFLTPEAAEGEIHRRFGPPLRPPRLVKFKSGRRERAWIRNAAAIGNACGFVEPLESTGLLMVTDSIRLLVDAVDTAAFDWARAAERYNAQVAASWDGLRWFLSIHYKFNRALDTPFWRAAREETDTSGLCDVLEAFERRGPLRTRDPVATRGFDSQSQVLFYGLAGIDCVLFGQKVPTRVPPSLESHASWLQRRDIARAMIPSALTMREALDLPDLATQHGAAAKLGEEDFTSVVNYSRVASRAV